MSAGKGKIVVGGLMIAFAIGISAFLIYRASSQTKTYSCAVVFNTMPMNDDAMSDWIRSQPGVLQSTVSRDGKNLIVVFVMSAHSREPEPFVVPAADKLGYAGWEGVKETCVLSSVFP